MLTLITNDQDPKVTLKNQIHKVASERVTLLVELINGDEEFKQIKVKMDNDKLFKRKITSVKASKEKVDEAKKEVLAKFAGKNIKPGDPIYRVVDMISEKLNTFDASNPAEIIDQVMNISKDISDTLKPDINGKQSEYQDSMNAVKDIFVNTLNDSNGKDQIPDEIRKIADVFFAGTLGTDQNSNNETIQMLETLIIEKGYNRDEFYKSIIDAEGKFQPDLLNKFMTEHSSSR